MTENSTDLVSANVVRCPKCRRISDVTDSETDCIENIYVDGEHDVVCTNDECGHEFVIISLITAMEFTSPPLIEEVP